MDNFVIGFLLGTICMFLVTYLTMKAHADKYRCWENDDGTPKQLNISKEK